MEALIESLGGGGGVAALVALVAALLGGGAVLFRRGRARPARKQRDAVIEVSKQHHDAAMATEREERETSRQRLEERRAEVEAAVGTPDPDKRSDELAALGNQRRRNRGRRGAAATPLLAWVFMVVGGVLLLGCAVDHFWFNPDWTNARYFWERWPFLLSGTALAVGGMALGDRTRR